MAKLSLIVLLTTLLSHLHRVQSTHHPKCKKHPSADIGILHSNACYYAYATPRNNSDAFAVCEVAHTNLVFFPEVTPQLQIMNLLEAENISKIWIGLKPSTPLKWAWKYKEDFYPLVSMRWAPDSPMNVFLEGATTSVNATWTRANVSDKYSFVCEDRTPLDLYSDGCADDSTATLVLYHPTLMKCYYYYISMFNYTRARDLCYITGRHILQLETQAEIDTFVHEMSARSLNTTLWLGMEEDEYNPDQWFWVDKHLMEPVAMNPWLDYSSTVGQNAVFRPNGTFTRALPTSYHRLTCEIDAFGERLGPFLCKSFTGGPVPVYRPATRHCYYPLESVESFTSARSRCESSGTHLMHADTDQELQLLFDKMPVNNGNNDIWLGLKRDPEGSWNWVSSNPGIPAGTPLEISDFCEPLSCPEMDLVYAQQEGAEWVQADSTYDSQTVCEEELSEAYVEQSLCNRHHGVSTAILDLNGRRCYYVLNDTMALDDASTTCDDGETHLLHIGSILEEQWLRAELGARFLSIDVWLGLKKTSMSKWSWFTPSWNILAKTSSFNSYDPTGPAFASLAATPGWVQTSPAQVRHVVCEQKLDISVVTVQTPSTTTEGPLVFSSFKRYSGSEVFEWIQTRNVTSKLDCARKCNMLTNCVMFKLVAESNTMTCSMMEFSTMGSVSDCFSSTHCYKKHSSGLL